MSLRIRKDDIVIYTFPFLHAHLSERLREKELPFLRRMISPSCPRQCVKVEQMACWNTSVQKVLNQLMKESDNLNAEALLCRLGAQATGKKQVAAEDGIVEIMKLIRRLGHDPKDYKIADGCGLSNYNYLSRPIGRFLEICLFADGYFSEVIQGSSRWRGRLVR